MEREEAAAAAAAAAQVRAEIDTSAPFRSVKEAVALFGERVLAGEVYAQKLKEIHAAITENKPLPSKLGSVTAELEETRESLKKAREEGEMMATSLISLRHELEQTKRELLQLRARSEPEKPPAAETEIEDLKFVENAVKVERQRVLAVADDDAMLPEFQRKRCVQFASPPLAQVIDSPESVEAVLERHPSLKRKKKKKPLIPLIGGIFSRKKAGGGGVLSRAQRAS